MSSEADPDVGERTPVDGGAGVEVDLGGNEAVEETVSLDDGGRGDEGDDEGGDEGAKGGVGGVNDGEEGQEAPEAGADGSVMSEGVVETDRSVATQVECNLGTDVDGAALQEEVDLGDGEESAPVGAASALGTEEDQGLEQVDVGDVQRTGSEGREFKAPASAVPERVGTPLKQSASDPLASRPNRSSRGVVRPTEQAVEVDPLGARDSVDGEGDDSVVQREVSDPIPMEGRPAGEEVLSPLSPITSPRAKSIQSLQSAVAGSPAPERGLEMDDDTVEQPMRSERQLPDAPIRLSADDVPINLKGLCKLMEAQSWRAAAEVAEQCYKEMSELKPHQKIQLMFCRISTLVQIRRYKRANEILQELGNLDDIKYTFDNFPETYKGLSGSFVPFALRIMRADLLAAEGNVNSSVDMLFSLLARCRVFLRSAASAKDPKVRNGQVHGWSSRDLDGILPLGDTVEYLGRGRENDAAQSYFESPFNTHEDIQLWHRREHHITFRLISLLMRTEECVLARSLLQDLCERYPKDDRVLSLLVRVNLHMGDVFEADRVMKQVAESCSDPVVNSMNAYVRVIGLCAFVALGRGNYESASTYFATVLRHDPLNISAANNHAICLLYECRLTKAIEALEDFIYANPQRNLHETVVFNLSTLYDLHSEGSAAKKRALGDLVERYGGETFAHSMLKPREGSS